MRQKPKLGRRREPDVQPRIDLKGLRRSSEALQPIVATHRYGICRVSPHVYNTQADIQNLLHAIDQL